MTHMCLALASGWEAWREGEVGWIPGDRVVKLMVKLMPQRHSDWQEMPLVGNFECLELCLYGIREQHHQPIRAQYLDGS